MGATPIRLGHFERRTESLLDRLSKRHQLRVRATLAEALERAVDEVDQPLRRGGSAVAVDRRAVAEAAPLLLRVAALLRDEAPLPTEALRLVRSLTGDGVSPLYTRSAHRSEYPPGTLSRFARAILAACGEGGRAAPSGARGAFVRG